MGFLGWRVDLIDRYGGNLETAPIYASPTKVSNTQAIAKIEITNIIPPTPSVWFPDRRSEK
jgi:hypothetical protein